MYLLSGVFIIKINLGSMHMTMVSWIFLSMGITTTCRIDINMESRLILMTQTPKSKYQSHYIEVAQGAIFMEQNMKFGLILVRFFHVLNW